MFMMPPGAWLQNVSKMIYFTSDCFATMANEGDELDDNEIMKGQRNARS